MTVELIEIGPLDRRRRCDCCGFPTLAVPDEYEPTPDWDLTPTSCPLCEWDSPPLDVEGNVRSNSSTDEERNDGLGLDVARRNFEQFASIYDPADLPVWKISPPSDDIVERRRTLCAEYTELITLDIDERFERLEHVHACEVALAEALAAQQDLDAEFDGRETDADI